MFRPPLPRIAAEHQQWRDTASGPERASARLTMVSFTNHVSGGTGARAMLLDEYLTYLRAAGSATGTVRLRKTQLRCVEAAYGPLEDRTSSDLIDWLANPDWKPQTRRSQRSALVGFYRWAVAEGYLDVDPSVRLPRVRVPASVARPLPSHVLAAALRRGISDRDHLMLSVAAFAGLRRAEIAELPWTGVEHDQLRVTGKGGVTRVIPLLDELRAELLAERRRRDAGTWGSGWRYSVNPKSPYVFPGMGGWDHLSADCVGRTLARLLGPGWTGHTVRHRFATKAHEVDQDLLAVQRLLGHSSPVTTAGYIAPSAEAARRAVAGTWIEAA